ncbi:MAG: ribosomal RNA adenine dimethylase domain-containing protein [Phycisphaerae bacterium]|nr:ribosomal RNA adenine dimethylase domain-containing protein [Phycisphaerae bacterium]
MKRSLPHFLSQYLRHPTEIGAIAPSSRYLARTMLDGIDFAKVGVAAEYGPGSGAFTRGVLASLRPGAAFLPIELNPHMATVFRTAFPGIQLHERSAAEMPAICRDAGLSGASCVDLVVSGLPWAAFPLALQQSILDATVAVLKPGARLVTFAYNVGLWTKAGQRFSKLLPDYFTRVERSRTVWRNLPPAFVYRCTR